MTDKDGLLPAFEKEYLPKIVGFSILKTANRADAEDLAQEISLEVLRTIRSGKEIENMNAWIWSISNHIFCKYLRRKKYGSGEYLPDTLASEQNIEEEVMRREQLRLLHRELAHLSDKYRYTMVAYYYHGKACEAIARELHVPSGTVKWWLHEARNQVKEGMGTMREFGEKSYDPGTLVLSCQGTPGADNEPMRCARSKAAQNILLAAYQKPLTSQELCAELGISAPYIEDDVRYLVKNQLLAETAPGKYQTDFVILPGDAAEMAVHLYESCFPEYADKLIGCLEKHKERLTSPAFNTAGFSFERLLWVYIHIVTDSALNQFRHEVCRTVRYADVPHRPNGGRWIALGFENSLFSRAKSDSASWKEYIPFDGPVQKSGSEFVQGFFHYWSGLDSTVFFNLPDGVFALCRKIVKGEASVGSLNGEEQYLFSIAVEKKLFVQCGNGFRQNYYFADSEARRQIEAIANGFYGTALPCFKKAWRHILAVYQATVPKHLHWQMGNFLSNYLNHFVTCSLYDGLKSGALSLPDENNTKWLSLFASEA